MADEPTAETAVTPETKAEPAAQATLPPEIEAAIKQMGYGNITEALEGAAYYKHAETPEGYRRLVENVAKAEGARIAKALIETDPDSVLKDMDKEARRKVRRAVARRDGSETPVPDEDAEDTPNPAEEAKAAAREAKEIAMSAQAETRTAAMAVAIAPQLMALAQRDPRIAPNFPEYSAEVTALISSGHPKYSGANGVKNASDDVVGRWERYGSMAGMKRPTPASPNKGADAPVPTREDAAKLVSEAHAEARGQGVGAFIDTLMKNAGIR